MKKFGCNNCVFIYEGEELPEDFVCPICRSESDEFVEMTDWNDTPLKTQK